VAVSADATKCEYRGANGRLRAMSASQQLGGITPEVLTKTPAGSAGALWVVLMLQARQAVLGKQHTRTQGKLSGDEALRDLNVFPVTHDVAGATDLETGRPPMIVALQRINDDDMRSMCHFLNRHCGSPVRDRWETTLAKARDTNLSAAHLQMGEGAPQPTSGSGRADERVPGSG